MKTLLKKTLLLNTLLSKNIIKQLLTDLIICIIIILENQFQGCVTKLDNKFSIAVGAFPSYPLWANAEQQQERQS